MDINSGKRTILKKDCFSFRFFIRLLFVIISRELPFFINVSPGDNVLPSVVYVFIDGT